MPSGGNPMRPTRDMSSRHEAILAEALGGRLTIGSGSSHDKMDVRHHPDEMFSFAVDGKSTLGKSIGVTPQMWEKAVEQADGQRPMLALLWFQNERLTRHGPSLIVAGQEDFVELLEAARGARAAEAALDAAKAHMRDVVWPLLMPAIHAEASRDDADPEVPSRLLRAARLLSEMLGDTVPAEFMPARG